MSHMTYYFAPILLSPPQVFSTIFLGIKIYFQKEISRVNQQPQKNLSCAPKLLSVPCITATEIVEKVIQFRLPYLVSHTRNYLAIVNEPCKHHNCRTAKL